LQEISSFERLRWWVLQTGTSSFYLEVQSQNAKSTHLLRMPDLSEQDSDEKDKTEQAWRGRGLMGVWSRAVLAEVLPGGAADAAGLKAGDEVLRVEGRQVSDANFLRNWVRDSGHQQIPSVQTWEVVRPGVGFFRVEVTPRQVNEMGQSFGRIDAKLGEPPAQVWVQSGAIDGLAEAVVRTYEAIRMTLSMLGRLLTGQASWDNLSGPLTMADYAGRSASLGVGAYFSYLALVSVSLGVFNLLPLPVLDGGHLLYYLYEALTGRAPSVDWLEALQRVGVVVLVALMSFSLFNDVVRLGWLP
jgi:regulator of sigma E protease